MFEGDGTTGPTTAQESLNDAMHFHMAGHLGQAEQADVQVLTHDYRASDVLPLLAGIVAKRGDIAMAIDYWDKLLTLVPDTRMHAVGPSKLSQICVPITQSVPFCDGTSTGPAGRKILARA
jgi:hypothetical protein